MLENVRLPLLIGLLGFFLYFKLPSFIEDYLGSPSPSPSITTATRMELLKNISRNILSRYPSKEEVVFETLWQERPCVVTFLRRFG